MILLLAEPIKVTFFFIYYSKSFIYDVF